ncbi:MAG: DNRLRE domain-containing protein [Dehalococcoidia bacterium]|nr:DNRLRE domain-containing protein [Dehalococcoidia bacterium]
MIRKAKLIPNALLAFIVIMATMLLLPASALADQDTFYSEAGLDGRLRYDGPDYNSDTAYTYCAAGTQPKPYTFRAYFSFDTSSLPDGATVTAAKLYLKTHTDQSIDYDFNDEVYRVDYGSSLDATVTEWNLYSSGTNEGNILSTASYVDETYFNIDVTAAEINKTGRTQYCVKSSDETIGGSNAYIAWYSADEGGTSSDPYLVVTYTLSSAPEFPTTFAAIGAIGLSGLTYFIIRRRTSQDVA